MAPASQEPKSTGTSRNNPRSTEERPTRNPYFNFLKDFRRENRGLNPNEVIRQGAEEWNQLSEAQRRPFVLEAMNQPPMERVRRAAPRSRSPRRRRSQARVGRSRSRSGSRSGSRSRRGGRRH
ncbi:protamine [Culex quinquefasciatus]|uniref:protamine n=1 Tax=Culex quinquefasciatus TaxID=7176 RepID=UPI0018E35304|nr:protamine [Culex quinquefasciatus]XP_039450781.1 protamine [Culex pipiens pallens]